MTDMTKTDKKCPHCGAPLAQDASFCPHCTATLAQRRVIALPRAPRFSSRTSSKYVSTSRKKVSYTETFPFPDSDFPQRLCSQHIVFLLKIYYYIT